MTLAVVLVACVATVMWLAKPTTQLNWALSDYRQSEQGKRNGQEVQAAKDAALKAYWEAELTKHNVTIAEARQQIEDIPRKSRASQDFRGFFWYGVTGALLSIILAIAFGLFIGTIKICTLNAEVIGMMIMGSKAYHLAIEGAKTDREHSRYDREYMKLMGAELQKDQSQQFLDAPIDIEAHNPTAMQAHERGLITKDPSTFLWGFLKDGTPHYLKTRNGEGFKVAVIGKTGNGKTFMLVNFMAQAHYKGKQIIVIDLQSGADRSVWKYMEAYAEKKNFLWCIKREDVIPTLKKVNDEIIRRLEGGKYETGLVIAVDDALGLARNKQFAELFRETMKACSTDGEKIDISMFLLAHAWHGAAVSTELRSNIEHRVAYKTTKLQANLLLDDIEVSKRVKRLKPGKCILVDSFDDAYEISPPHWTPEALREMASGGDEIPIRLDSQAHETFHEPAARIHDEIPNIANWRKKIQWK